MDDVIGDFLRSDILVALAWAWVGFWLLLSLLVRRAKGKPIFAPVSEGLLFSEKWTSGRSRKSWWTRLGGANNCLFVGVDRDTVHVHPHFPFSLGFMPEIYDLDQDISIERITRVEKTRSFRRDCVRLIFADATSTSRTFELRLRNVDPFIVAIQAAPTQPRAR